MRKKIRFNNPIFFVASVSDSLEVPKFANAYGLSLHSNSFFSIRTGLTSITEFSTEDFIFLDVKSIGKSFNLIKFLIVQKLQ